MVKCGAASLMEVRKKVSFDHELISTCYHEAGHTLSGLLHFMKISDVGVETTQDKRIKKDLGYTNFEAVLDCDEVINSNLSHSLLISELYINYAGLAAEKIFYKDVCGIDRLPMTLKYGSWMDRSRAAEIVKKYNLAPPGKKRYYYKHKMFIKTQNLLREYWDDIKLISHNLFNKKKLYFEDLRKILSTKSSKKKFWKNQFKQIDAIFEASKINDESFILSIISN